MWRSYSGLRFAGSPQDVDDVDCTMEATEAQGLGNTTMQRFMLRVTQQMAGEWLVGCGALRSFGFHILGGVVGGAHGASMFVV